MMVGIGSGVGSGHMITVRLPFDGSRDARPWRRSGSSEVAFVRSAPRRAPADPSHPRVVVSTLCAGSIRRRRLVRRFRAPQPGPRRGRMRGGGRPVRPVGGRWRLLAAGQRVARLRHGLDASALCAGVRTTRAAHPAGPAQRVRSDARWRPARRRSAHPRSARCVRAIGGHRRAVSTRRRIHTLRAQPTRYLHAASHPHSARSTECGLHECGDTRGDQSVVSTRRRIHTLHGLGWGARKSTTTMTGRVGGRWGTASWRARAPTWPSAIFWAFAILRCFLSSVQPGGGAGGGRLRGGQGHPGELRGPRHVHRVGLRLRHRHLRHGCRPRAGFLGACEREKERGREGGRERACFVSAVACAACDSSRVGCLHARDSSAGGGGGRRLRLRDHGQRRQRPGETSTPLRKFTKLSLPLSMAGAGAADGSAGGGRGRAPTWWWATATSRAPTWPATTASCRARCVRGLPCCVSKYNTVMYLDR